MTMTLKELEAQLLSLNPTQKAEAIRILTQTLSNKSLGITKTPEVFGGDARIVNTRLPVWLFVSLRRQGAADTSLLMAFTLKKTFPPQQGLNLLHTY